MNTAPAPRSYDIPLSFNYTYTSRHTVRENTGGFYVTLSEPLTYGGLWLQIDNAIGARYLWTGWVYYGVEIGWYSPDGQASSVLVKNEELEQVDLGRVRAMRVTVEAVNEDDDS